MKNWAELRKELLANKEVKKEYEKLKPQYELIAQLIEARVKKGMTQKDLAKKMGTRQSAIARLESGNSNPSLAFLGKIAKATGHKLSIQIT